MNEFGSLGFNKSLAFADLRHVINSTLPDDFKSGYKKAFADLIALWFTSKEKEYVLSHFPDLFPL